MFTASDDHYRESLRQLAEGYATITEMFHLQWRNLIGWLRSLVVFQGQRELLQG
jgi:hypothetical protein